MLNFFRADPTKKLQRRYHAKLAEAMEAQRNGDLARFAELTEQADVLARELESLEHASGNQFDDLD